MSQEDIHVQHDWKLKYFRRGNDIITDIITYSNFFESSSIPGVKFEIFCCNIYSFNLCRISLSKTPYTPANATITMKCLTSQESVRKTVDSWREDCTFKIEFEIPPLLRLFQYNPPYIISFQCDITWHAFKKPKPQMNIYTNLKSFFNITDLSDMTIIIDENEIPVHKIILAAYSPVFLAMFKADMTEAVNKRIVITDIEVDIMKKVIEFMYTGELDSTLDFNDLLSVLEVADKYQIMILKKSCEERLTEGITTDNVLKILERASLYRVPQLMETLISFMVDEKLEIIELEDFADLSHRKPELLLKFIHGLAHN